MQKLATYLILNIAVWMALTQIACNNDADNCLREEKATIISIMAPDTVSLNSTSLIDIQFQVTNGCGDFNRLVENRNGNKVTVEVEAIYRGCVCTANLPLLNVNYEFTPNTVGSYVLQFGSGSTPDVIKQIEVIP